MSDEEDDASSDRRSATPSPAIAPPSTGKERNAEDALSFSSSRFDAKLYIRTKYRDKSYGEFVGSVVPSVEEEEAEADSNIKRLVQTHLSVFIECKDSMDTLYENEKDLFTGSSLDGTEKHFDAVIRSAQSTTKTLLRLYDGVKEVKLQQETLAKLMSVLRIPGDVYSACGCRVLQPQSARHSTLTSSGADLQVNGSDDEHNSSLDDTNTDSDSEGGDGTQRWGLGNSGEAGSSTLRRQLKPTEVLRGWCGVPLAVVAGSVADAACMFGAQSTADAIPTTQATKHAAVQEDRFREFDAAAQSLRVAMSFLDDHTNITNSRPLTPVQPSNGVSRSPDPASSKAASVPHSTSASAEAPENDSEEGDHEFVFCFARSVLCSGLFLNRCLFEALTMTSYADAVRIENFLSLMMETSITTVKLRHLCAVLQEKLLERTAAGQAFQKLQRALQHATNHDSDAEGDHAEDSDDGSASVMSAATKRSDASLLSGRVSAAGSAQATAEGWSVAPSNRRAVAMHPVEAYLAAFKDRHIESVISQAKETIKSSESTTFRSAVRKQRRQFFGADATSAASMMQRTIHSYELGNLADSFVVNVPATAGKQTRSQQQPSGADDDAMARTISLNNTAFGDDFDAPLGSNATDDDASQLRKEDAATREALEQLQPQVTLVGPLLGGEGRKPPPPFERNILLGGSIQLRSLLISTSDELLDQAASLSRRVEAQDAPVPSIMSSAGSQSTALLAFLQMLLSDAEQRVSAYWRGVGRIIHSGFFDMNIGDDDPLSVALRGKALDAAGTGSLSQQQWIVLPEDAITASLPAVQFLPVRSPPKAPPNKTPLDSAHASLLESSVGTMKRILERVTEIAARLIRAFGRHATTNGFLLSIVGPATANGESETSKLGVQLATAYEVLISHIQLISASVCVIFSQLKSAIGETARQKLVVSDEQLSAITDLLMCVETCRDELVVACMFSGELVARMFVVCYTTHAHPTPLSAGPLHPRISRDFATTSLPTACFNALVVLVDRLSDPFRRFDEIFRGVELMFSDPSEALRQQTQIDKSKGSTKSRKGKKKVAEVEDDAPPLPDGPDPIAAAVANFNAQAALEVVSRHEEMLQIAVGNVCQTFMDACHMRCHAPVTENQMTPAQAAAIEVECIADLLSVSKVLLPLVLDRVLVPTVLGTCSRLAQYDGGKGNTKFSSDQPTGPEVAATTKKRDTFLQSVAPMVSELEYMAIEAILQRLVHRAESEVASLIHHDGVVRPSRDWADAWSGSTRSIGGNNTSSSPSLIRVRPYVTECLLVAAKLQERLAALNVPAVAFSALLRLGHFIANSFTMMMHAGAGGYFECSPDHPDAFYVSGVLLLECEGRFLVSSLKKIKEASQTLLQDAPHGSGGELSEFHRVAESMETLSAGLVCLEGLVESLAELGQSECDAALKAGSGVPFFVPTQKERNSIRDAAVKQATDAAALVVDSLTSFVDAAALAIRAGGTSAASQNAAGKKKENFRSFDSIIARRRPSMATAKVSPGQSADEATDERRPRRLAARLGKREGARVNFVAGDTEISEPDDSVAEAQVESARQSTARKSMLKQRGARAKETETTKSATTTTKRKSSKSV